MLKSAISSSLFNSFSSTYQAYSEDSQDVMRPFVYVDTDGNVKLLTNVVEDDGNTDGIFAVSMAEDGWMEFLAMR